MVEKVVSKELSQFCKEYLKLHLGQIEDQKAKLAIDVVVMFVHTLQENLEQKKLAEEFFIDI